MAGKYIWRVVVRQRTEMHELSESYLLTTKSILIVDFNALKERALVLARADGGEWVGDEPTLYVDEIASYGKLSG